MDELQLQRRSKMLYCYRDDEFFFAEEDTRLEEKDEVVILISGEPLKELRERRHPKKAENDDCDLLQGSAKACST